MLFLERLHSSTGRLRAGRRLTSRKGTLQPNKFCPFRLIVIIEPIREHQPRQIIGRLLDDGFEEGGAIGHALARRVAARNRRIGPSYPADHAAWERLKREMPANRRKGA